MSQQISRIEPFTRLRDRVEVLLSRSVGVLARHRRRVVVDDLPLAIDEPPHVREARLHRLAGVLRASHEGVHAGVEVGVRGEALHGVGGDLADWQALHEVLEVAASSMGVANEVRRHGREESEIRSGVEGSGSVIVPGLQSLVPSIEVRLPSKKNCQMSLRNSVFKTQTRHLSNGIHLLATERHCSFGR